MKSPRFTVKGLMLFVAVAGFVAAYERIVIAYSAGFVPTDLEPRPDLSGVVDMVRFSVCVALNVPLMLVATSVLTYRSLTRAHGLRPDDPPERE